MKSKFSVYVGLLASMIFWAISYIWVKESLKVFNPVSLVFFRLSISGILLLIFSKSINKLQKIKKSELKYFIALAFFDPFLYFIGETFGLRYMSSTLSAILISTIPLFVPLFLLLFYKEKLLFYNILGIIISIIGVALIIFKKDFSLVAPLKGFLFMGLAVFAAVIYTVVIVKIAHKYSAFTIIAIQNTFGAIGFFILFLFFDLHNFNISTVTIKNFIPIIKLAILPSSVSFVLFTIAIKKIGANQASVFTNLIPVLTAIFAYFLLSEEITLKTIIGIIIVIIGLFISQKKSKVKKYIVSE